MNAWIEKNRKIIFFVVMGIFFIAIFVFNFLTPNMSDDLKYYSTVRQAKSFWDLFAQEYEHHMTHSGRNVAHFILRIFLYNGKGIFNVFNAFIFMLLSFEIYLNASARKKYDFELMIIIQLLLWTQTVRIDETMLWEDGSCNYLWTTTIILGFVTVYRHMLKNSAEIAGKSKAIQILIAIGILLMGVLAGWSNENNSGGCFLLVLGFIFCARKELKRKAWVYTGPLGILIGMALMLSSPANWQRNEYDSASDKYTGVTALLSHFIKDTEIMRRLFWILAVIFIGVSVYLYMKKTPWNQMRILFVWIVSALLTGYVLIFTAVPVDRAFFGMGIFIIVGTVDGISMLLRDKNNVPVQWLKNVVVIVGCLWFITTWIEQGTNLARIDREFIERDEIAAEQIAQGNTTVILPMIRTDFDNRYTNVYKVELSEDPTYWVNMYYEELYNVETVIGVDRETWEETYGE